MRIIRSPSFKRAYRKLETEQMGRVDSTLRIFAENPIDPRLRNHKLTGTQKGIRSISAGYDLRILYYEKGGHTVAILIRVGSHDEVYG